MKLSDAGLAFLQREEGTVIKLYRDQAGLPTVCTGHLVKPDDHSWIDDGITRDECADVLRDDVARFEVAVTYAATVSLEQGQFDALVSLAFNIGAAAFAKSTLVAVLNTGDYAGAADRFLDWRNAGGAAVLLPRRKRERAMFLAARVDAPLTDAEREAILAGLDLGAELDVAPVHDPPPDHGAA